MTAAMPRLTHATSTAAADALTSVRLRFIHRRALTVNGSGQALTGVSSSQRSRSRPKLAAPA